MSYRAREDTILAYRISTDFTQFTEQEAVCGQGIPVPLQELFAKLS